MPELKVQPAGQLTSLEEILNYVEKLRKEVTWLFGNLDTSNIAELNAKVINAGSINADQVKVEAPTSGITLDSTGLHTTFAGGATLIISNNGLTVTYPDGTAFSVTEDGVTVDKGHYFLATPQSEPEIVGEGNNMVRDHSFESLITQGDSMGDFTYQINQTWSGNYFWWNFVGSPLVRSMRNSDSPPFPKFGYQSILVNNANYAWQQMWVKKEAPNGPYNLSVYAAPRGNNTPGATVKCRLVITALDDDGDPLGSVAGEFIVTNSYSSADVAKYKRGSVTYPTLPVGTTRLQITVASSDSQWVEVDGVSLVPFSHPTVYSAEDSFWGHLHDEPGMFHRNMAIFGNVTMANRDGLGASATFLHPYNPETGRVVLGNDAGFEVRKYGWGFPSGEMAFAVNTENLRCYLPWISLNGVIDTVGAQSGSLRWRTALGSLQVHDGGGWRSLAYEDEVSGAISDVYSTISSSINSAIQNHISAYHAGMG